MKPVRLPVKGDAAPAALPLLPAEVTPRCRHFGTCGGCQLQHLTQATQAAAKAEAVRTRLAAAGVTFPAFQIHTAEEYGYRNRIRLRLSGGRLGYNRQASNEFLPVEECPIAAPRLWQTASALQAAAADANTPWPVGSSEVELCTTADESAVQLLLHVDSTVGTLDRDAPRHLRALCEALRQRVPQLTGAGLLVQGELQQGTRRVQERQRVEVARWGEPGLAYVVAGIRYDVSRGAFFQINRFLTGRMVELVLGERAGSTAWDLYAGAGLFSVPLTHRFSRVTSVEVGQPAANDLARALRGSGEGHGAVARPVLDFLRHYHGPAPQLAVLDPPRAGLGSAVTGQLARIAPVELVYVSCDAGTFAQDARALVDSRYAVTELHLLDLFPQTIHTETVAVFRRE